jgi:protoporphyrinogen oxidase
LYEIGIAQAIEIGLLSNYTIRVVQIDMSEEKNIVAGSKNKKFMTSEKKQYQYLTKSLGLAMNDRDVSQKVKQMKTLFRMRAIQNSPSKLRITKMLLQHLTGRVLIFAGSIRQAEELCKHTYHSKTDNKHYKMFQEEQIDRIAMVNTGGTGFTYTKLDHLVLVQADSDNNGITSQKIARTLLKQGDYQAKVWIICLMGTQDEEWIRSTLNKFDSTKISYKKK